jgi:hypothetical protein
MAKAYDRVNWRFLLTSLRKLGFSDQWRNLIYNCISSPFYSIMLNGMTRGFFKPSRGLRQGDPLSPYLYILAQELLSRMINQAFDRNHIQPFHFGGLVVSHLFYADDLLIFANGKKKSIGNLLHIVKKYEMISGQMINPMKSSMFFSKHISVARKRNLLASSGFKEGVWPCTYLGVPLYTGRLMKYMFEPMMDKIQKKLAGWKGRLLSFGGKITLIKHVLCSMPIHILSVLNLPKGIHNELNRIFSSFLWNASDGSKRRKWISWRKICYPVDEGGLGIRDFSEV